VIKFLDREKFELNKVNGVFRQLPWVLFFGCSLLLFISSVSFSYNEKPEALPADAQAKELIGVGLDEKLGQDIDPSLSFKDESGKEVLLGDYFGRGLPVIISPVYYGCAHLCNFHLDGLFAGLRELEWTAGQQFLLLAVSFDPNENFELAEQKKQKYLERYNRLGSQAGIHFLTGKRESIDRLMAQLGFKAKFNEESKDWAHSSAAIVASAQGKVMRYLPGISFEAKDLKFAINESAQGRAGGLVDALVLYCFQYNPHKSGYSLAAFKVMQVGGAIMLVVFALFLIPFWLRIRKEHKKMTRSAS